MRFPGQGRIRYLRCIHAGVLYMAAWVPPASKQAAEAKLTNFILSNM